MHADFAKRRLSSRSPSADDEKRSKRPRAPAACEACRSRKLGCTGEQPCPRCVQEKKECYYAGRAQRTPLTRLRMTELEQRIELYERIWDTLLPEFPLQDASRLAEELGVDGVMAHARQLLVPDHHKDQHRAARGPGGGGGLPLSLTQTPFPSRPASPHAGAEALKPLLHPDVDPETYEYHEVPAPRALGQPPDDPGLDGMASLASSEQGVSYLGLSSGATFLNAIRRLGPKEILGVSPVGQAIANGGTELRGILSFAQGISASTEYAKPAIPPMLTPTPALPPMSEVMPLVDSYFRYFHHLTPLVHEPTVRAQIMGALPISSKPGSLVLLYMIFAMGALDLPASGIDDPGYNYYLVARQALTRDLLEEGTLPLVQGLAIMANYLQRSNRPNAGYLCLGWATRMATALGLHAPITSWRCTPLEKEMRVRVWWAVVTLEAGCSVTFGRPHGIGGVGQSAVPMPINCNDEHLTVSTMVAPPEVSHPTLYTALIIQARLARITASIHDRILSGHPAPTVEQIKRYDDRIVSVIDALPDFMQKCHDGPYRLARSVQVWRARDFRAILYRPVLLAAAWEGRPRKELSASVREAIGTCRTLALANLDDIARFVLSSPDPARGSEWYTLFFAFQASLTLLLSIVWEPNHPEAAGWRNKLVNTASWFRQLHSMRKLGTAYAQILESIVGVVPSPVEALSGSAGMQESPSGWPTLDGQQSSLDVERYWTEIWGELAPPNMNLGWDGFAPLNAQGQAQNGTGMDGWSSMLSFQ